MAKLSGWLNLCPRWPNVASQVEWLFLVGPTLAGTFPISSATFPSATFSTLGPPPLRRCSTVARATAPPPLRCFGRRSGRLPAAGLAHRSGRPARRQGRVPLGPPRPPLAQPTAPVAARATSPAGRPARCSGRLALCSGCPAHRADATSPRFSADEVRSVCMYMLDC
ncbi:hypothetical protein GUJ93_ZPchr0012g21436 [Zizania palustris]|uniref:Uncharacterized protein n=1 Tax=Zizania palustris TaxID=103762 RepID=A0A8J5WRI8_ZIZPA|nr:hypothetical protein GUJ93_ZPchr0012g21436 [Zizania palustris]